MLVNVLRDDGLEETNIWFVISSVICIGCRRPLKPFRMTDKVMLQYILH